MQDLKLKFKGGRDYIHGPDIFNVMYKQFEDDYNIKPSKSKLLSRKMAKKQLGFTTKKIKNRPFFSVFEAGNKSENIIYYLYELDEKINESIDYDEDDIVDNAIFNYSGKEAKIEAYERYTISEISVALLKKLCTESVSNSVKWIFVEMELTDSISLYTKDHLKITIEKNLGTKMVVASIHMNENKIGTIKFSSK